MTDPAIYKSLDRFITSCVVTFLCPIVAIIGFFTISPQFGYFYLALQFVSASAWFTLALFAKKSSPRPWLQVFENVFFYILAVMSCLAAFAFMILYCRWHYTQHNASISRIQAAMFLFEFMGMYAYNKVMSYLYITYVDGVCRP